MILSSLNEAETTPFAIDDEQEINEEIRLRYRYLDLRRPVMQQTLKLRHTTSQEVRKHLSNIGFMEIETPFLMKSTPEGARDYLVGPVRLERAIRRVAPGRSGSEGSPAP